MWLPIKYVDIGEVRVDPVDLLPYKWNGTSWVLEGSVAGSSDGLPAGDKVWEIRTDIKTGKDFKWSGSEWVAREATEPDKVSIIGSAAVGKVIKATSSTTAEWGDDEVWAGTSSSADIVSFTRDMTVASGTQVINHSLWAVPKNITFSYYSNPNWFWAPWYTTTGFSTLAKNITGSIDPSGVTVTILFTTACIAAVTETLVTQYIGAITEWTSTTFTITWTKTGSTTGTLVAVANIIA